MRKQADPAPPRPELGIALNALMILTPHERGLVLCWFCDACHEYVGPDDRHRCTMGSAIYPPADEVT